MVNKEWVSMPNWQVCYGFPNYFVTHGSP